MIFKVKTTGVCEAKPNRIVLFFGFVNKSDTYEQVVELGAHNVNDFIKWMDEALHINDVKTLSYNITKENKRIEKITDGRREYEYVFSHYEHNQSASVEIPYDKVKLFTIINEVSKMVNGPTVHFEFKLSNDELEQLEKEATAVALNLAFNKANEIKKILDFKQCVCSQSEIVESFESTRTRNSDMQFECCAKMAAPVEEMANSIEPKDVTVRINVKSEFELF